MSMRYFSEPGLKDDDSLCWVVASIVEVSWLSPSYRDQTLQSAFPEVFLTGNTDML